MTRIPQPALVRRVEDLRPTVSTRYFHRAVAVDPGRLSDLTRHDDHARQAWQAAVRARHARDAPDGWARVEGRDDFVEITTLHEHESPSHWAREAVTRFLADREEVLHDAESTATRIERAVLVCAIDAPFFGLGAVPLPVAAAIGGGVLGDAASLGLELGFWSEPIWSDLDAVVGAIDDAIGESRSELLDDARDGLATSKSPSSSRTSRAESIVATRQDALHALARDYAQRLRALAADHGAAIDLVYRAP